MSVASSNSAFEPPGGTKAEWISDAHLSEAQRLSRTGSWAWNPNTGKLFWSPEMFRIYGFDPTDAAPPYEVLRQRVHPDDRPAADGTAEQAVRDHREFDMGYRVLLPDGTVTYIRTVGHPVFDAHGSLVEFIGTVVDVTDRRRAEEAQARRALELALRADFNNVFAHPEGLRGMLQGCAEALVKRLDVAFARIWTMSHSGTVLELQASAGLYTHLDGSHAQVPVGSLKIGLIAQERAPHITNAVLDDPRIHDKLWAARERMVAFAGYPLVVEDRVVGVMAMFSRQPLLAETLETLSSIAPAVAQGIERKRSEEKLKRSEASLAEGQRLSHTGSWAWNLESGERFWSKEVFRIYGFDEASSPPSLEEVLQRVHPDDQPHVRRILEDAFRDGTDFRFETRIQIPSGSKKWVETVGHPLRGDRNQLIEFIGTDIDITERKRANRLLRRAIRARYDAVLEERTRLARDMHDGLLQDVTGISLQLRALLPHVRTSPDVAAARLEKILELTERTSREARQAIVGIRAPEPSGDLVAAIESSAQRAVASSPLPLSLVVKGHVRPAATEVRDAACSIIREAITNVLKHANARSLRVTIAFQRSRVRLAIRDDGRGLTCDVGAASPGEHFGIVGMRERASAIGGTLSMTGLAGGGTVVRVEFPLSKPSPFSKAVDAFGAT